MELFEGIAKLAEGIAGSNTEQKISLLPQALEYGELGINFLIECLGNEELEIRAKAYELLQGVESKQAKKAIASGLLLNPGDRIYSVYQSEIWFTDSSYLLFDYIDILADLRKEVYGQEYCEDNLIYDNKRVFCYLDFEQAEQAAETLHRKLIRKSGAAYGGFRWEKENPDFDLKQWCLNNKLLSEQKWDKLPSHQIDWRVKKLIQESQDKTLIDKFNRSKYIYHSDYIDVWCRDNQISYDYSLNNWENLQKLFDYLYLPENIELLSKFCKDGIGHFAFVKEEIVRQKVYINIEEINKTDIAKQLVAKPKEYDRLAIYFLIEVLERNASKSSHKLKARELLQDFQSEYLPF